MVSIISRAEWGAQHGRGTADPGPEARVVLHHSYKPALEADASPTEERHAVRGIERYHVESNGWAGIGYNWLVAPSGRVYEGRGWKYRGSHAGLVNGQSIGICLLIDGTRTDPGPKLVTAVRALIREGVQMGEVAASYTLTGHRDHMPRTCPGDLVYKRLQEFRHDAGPPLPTAEPEPDADAPKPGERRWSNYFGEYIILTEYRSDTDWRFVRESQLKRFGMRASVRWSEMPREP